MESLPPQDYVQRGSILRFNGFGIQYAGYGTDEDCLIATLSNPARVRFDQLLADIRRDSGCDSVKLYDWIGCNVIAVHWKDTDKILDVLNAVLSHRISFHYFNRFKPRIERKDFPLTEEKLESIYMVRLDMYIKMFQVPPRTDPNYASRLKQIVKPEFKNMLYSWNWKTPEGKAYSQNLRQLLHKKPENESKNYLNHDLFKNYNPKTLLTIVPESQCIEMDMKCPKDSLLTPQGHFDIFPVDTECVVCKECSVQLRDTNINDGKK